MKIGIITLSASNNCGSLLQTYALKTLLEQFGDVEVINFYSDASHMIYDIIPRNLYKHPRRLIKRLEALPALYSESKGYTRFRKRAIGISGREIHRPDLIKITDKYDIVVAGSDQVWNVMMSDFDEAFLCDWTNSKKVAFAPSLGGHDVRESNNSKKYIESIKKFSSLSAREEFGKKCLEEITGREVKRILDPTMVVGTETWTALIGKPIVEGDYIFFYSWAYNDDNILKIVTDEQIITGLPVYVIDGRKWVNRCPKTYNYIMSKEQGPLAFLNLMYYANRCYVESFHGVIFAHMFKKNYWLLDYHKNYEVMDTRLKELCSLLKIQERILTPYNYKSINHNNPILYTDNIQLQKLRNESIMYLKEAMI